MNDFILSLMVSAVWIFGIPPATHHDEWMKNLLIFFMGAATMAAYQQWQRKRKAKSNAADEQSN